MEATLIFLFLFFSILVAYLAKHLNYRILLGIPFLILVILGMNIIQYGYQTQTSVNTYQFNYTYFAASSSQEVTGMNVTKVPNYTTTSDINTQMLGIGVTMLGFACGLVAAFNW